MDVKWIRSLILLIILAVGTTMYNNANGQAQVSQRDVKCLAYNIYYEANNQPLEGRIAIWNVTHNRIKSPQFANSVCGVVYDKSYRKDGTPYCEFSWAKPTKGKYCTHSGKKPSREAYKKIKELAENVLSHNEYDKTNGALFYHADYINGGWFKRNLTYIKQIGTHKFYK